MAAGRIHRKCSGRGFIALASGADGHCFGCNGTGIYTPATKEQLAAQDNWHRAYAAFVRMPRDFQPLADVSRVAFRSGVMAGLERLAETEPHRLPALYATIDSGRIADVAVHLYRYAQEG